MKNLLEIIMPASLTAVAGAIAVCLFTLGDYLSASPNLSENVTAAADSVVATPYGMMRITATGIERLPDSLAIKYMSPADSAQFFARQDPAAVAAGDALFKSNCAQCHAVNEVVVGPALAGIRKRRPETWIRAWVKNSGKLVARGDEYAVKVFNQYQQQQMPSFQLSDQEISQILDYIETHQGQGVAYAPARP
ncbi:c-type cytochrome [Hymenobacter swuensis]|uniref:Cytochrome c domain-containing protein n=1 Tax=Hymenobacter swuensis DY53 TaxID=1227739 RepID=W8EWU5_9BACT|nr:cytochrome c [Hymenobacter swuensis]AHJ97033.1 hypothetical protein Hsw_1438 [Hymenobacter swuensis DY53]